MLNYKFANVRIIFLKKSGKKFFLSLFLLYVCTEFKIKKIMIKQFEVTSGKLVCSDPCYTIPTWCQGIVENVENRHIPLDKTGLHDPYPDRHKTKLPAITNPKYRPTSFGLVSRSAPRL